MIDQGELANLVTELMDRIDQMSADAAELGDVCLVAEIVVGDEHSVILIQTNQLRKHRLEGLLMNAERVVSMGEMESG